MYLLFLDEKALGQFANDHQGGRQIPQSTIGLPMPEEAKQVRLDCGRTTTKEQDGSEGHGFESWRRQSNISSVRC